MNKLYGCGLRAPQAATFLNELADIALQLLTLERGAYTFTNCANQMTWLLKSISH